MKREKVNLPVVERLMYPNKAHYIVTYNGLNYRVRLFDFQREQPVPAKIACVVSRDGGKIEVKQDLEPLLMTRYKAGESYDFTVDLDLTKQSGGFYKLVDGSGFWLRLYPSSAGEKLRVGQRVRCRVISSNRCEVRLKAEKVLDFETAEPMALETFLSVFDRFPLMPRLAVRHWILADRESESMRADGNPEWVFALVRKGWAALEKLPAAGVAPARIGEFLKVFAAAATYLLEDSDYLKQFSDFARVRLQDELSVYLSRSTDYERAIAISSVPGAPDEYIQDIFAKLRTSGYLYKPENKLRTLIYIYSLDPAQLDHNMADFLRVILNGNPESWTAEPFSSALRSQLQIFIDSNHQWLDGVSAADNPEELDRLNKILQALAIQQLLAPGSDDPEIVVNRSRFYRYYTYRRDNESTQLLDNALNTVVNGTAGVPGWSWKQIVSMGDAAQGAYFRVLQADDTPSTFETPDSRSLTVSGRELSLTAPELVKAVNVAPKSPEGAWRSIKVYLPHQLPSELRDPRSLPEVKAMWDHIIREFRLDPAEREASPAKMLSRPAEPSTRVPERGDRALIAIDGPDADYPTRLRCHVVEEGLSGSGYLYFNFATFAKKKLIDSGEFEKIFRNKAGEPYILDATVSRVDEKGALHFDFDDDVWEFLEETVNIDDEFDCVTTTNVNARTGKITAFSDRGFSVLLDPNGFDIGQKQYVRARLIDSDWRKRRIYAECIGTDRAPMDYASGLRQLIRDYSGGEVEAAVPEEVATPVDTQSEEVGEMAAPLLRGEAEEIMHTVARAATIEPNHSTAYGYFSFAILLAGMLGLDEMAAYYEKRCQMLIVLDAFATNGRVDLEGVDSFRDSADHSPEARQLRALALMERPELRADLWELARDHSPKVASVAELVLAYNLLEGHQLPKERDLIRERIYSELGLQIEREPTRIAGGDEKDNVEFKSSLIFLQNGFHLNVEQQTREIIEALTAMLNTRGGSLYIGVSDNGYIRGLDNDLKYFARYTAGDIDKARDLYSRHITQNFEKLCGTSHNFSIYVEDFWHQDEFGKYYYELRIQPCRRAVAVDGTYYKRVGRSTLPVHKADEKQWLADRMAD